MKVLLNAATNAINDASNVGAWAAPEGFVIAEVDGDAETYQWPGGHPTRCVLVDGQIALSPAGFEALKVKRWTDFKAARDAAATDGFMFAEKLFQSDPVSRDNIAGAALAASFAKAANAPYVVEWTCADNSLIELDADQIIAMFLAGAAHVKAAYAHGVELRRMLEGAETAEEVQALVWRERT